MKLTRLVLLFVAALSLGACDFGSSTGPSDPSKEQFAGGLGIDLSTFTKLESGVYIKDNAVGTGRPVVASDRVRLHYTLFLKNGTRVESSRDVNQPLEFVTASGRVVPGFDIGVLGMRAGGQRRIIIPSALGYGAAPNGNIPANSTLIFDLELLAITTP